MGPLLKQLRRFAGIPVTTRARAISRRFLIETKEAGSIQRRFLLDLINRHQASGFGRDHGFGAIRSIDDYRKAVPIRDYDGHEPYISRVRNGEISALFGSKTDLIMFAMTSGTTSNPKTIPVTRDSLQHYRDGWRIWGIRAFDDHPEMLRYGLRPILQLASDWQESRTPSGIPCGAITGLTASMMNPLIRLKYCMPPIASRIKDVEAKYYVALRVSASRQVGALIAANPSTLIGMARLGDRERETLIRDLFDGTIASKWPIPPEVRKVLEAKARRKQRSTARRLEAIVNETGRLRPIDLWPDLLLLANWTGGAMGTYLSHYPDLFGDVPVRDPGLIASEGRMTIPIDDHSPAGVLDFAHNFYEFIEEKDEDSAEPETITATDLVEGKRYFIVLTTAGGLYRYDIRDLVQCVGFEGEAPVLEFLNKGSHVSSLTGEKLSEFQVIAASQRVQKELGCTFSSFLVVPTPGDPPSYRLLLESDDLLDLNHSRRIADSFEAELCRQNLEYQSKRETLRLGSIEVRALVPGSWVDYRSRRLARTGGTLEQYKQPCLVSDPQVIEGFQFAESGPLSSGVHQRQARVS